MTLRILCDDNIFDAERCLAPLGEVRLLPGRDIRRADVMAADVLLVRSQTRVDAALLDGASLRFVGTATVGTDHVDLEALRARGIPFAHAPGSNAEAVADWVLATLGVAVLQTGRSLDGARVGIVGAGNIGGRVARRLHGLGLEVVICDPPRQRAQRVVDDLPFVDLETALGCEVISVHVPLVRSGRDATAHLLDAAALSRLSPDGLLLHAARGGVVDDVALLRRCRDGLCAALDVWDGEPDVSPQLLEALLLGTPHIAGHSLDGKARGTRMLFEALASVLQRDAHPDLALPLGPALHCHPDTAEPVSVDDPALWRCVLQAYDPRRDAADLARVVASREVGGFDRLRRHYRQRRDFEACSVQLPASASLTWWALLGATGFGHIRVPSA